METEISRDQKKREIIKALSVFVKAGNRIDKLLALREETLSQAIYKSPSFNSPGVNSCGLRPDKMAYALGRIESIDKKIFKVAEHYPDLYDYVAGILENNITDYKQRIVMEWRYINGAQWKEIAKHTGYVESHCYRLHELAIKTLIKNDILKNNEGETN